MNQLNILQYLVYLNLGLAHEYSSEHCFAMKSGSTLPFCNRVCGTHDITGQEISDVAAYFGATPFRWFVDSRDTQQIEKLEHNQFTHAGGFPGMMLSLDELPSADYGPCPAKPCAKHGDGISIREISDIADIKQWVAIVAQSYGTDAVEFEKFIMYLHRSCPPGTIRFYCGYYQGTLVATTVTIAHGDIVGVHWVGTLPAYRGKGMGYAITHKSLIDAKHDKKTCAILLASEMGKPIYAKMGFKECVTYNVYKRG